MRRAAWSCSPAFSSRPRRRRDLDAGSQPDRYRADARVLVRPGEQPHRARPSRRWRRAACVESNVAQTLRLSTPPHVSATSGKGGVLTVSVEGGRAGSVRGRSTRRPSSSSRRRSRTRFGAAACDGDAARSGARGRADEPDADMEPAHRRSSRARCRAGGSGDRFCGVVRQRPSTRSSSSCANASTRSAGASVR